VTVMDSCKLNAILTLFLNCFASNFKPSTLNEFRI
jgi:hypothetical protein